MIEKYKYWLYAYFLVGYIWSIGAGFIQLAYFENINLWIYMVSFLLNMTFWPLSMFGAAIWAF